MIKPEFALFMFLILLSMLLLSCNTKLKTGSLSGAVSLINDTGDAIFDPVDFSGVTIALYHPAKLDTTLVRIINEYPQIGVHISQETQFDHRNFQPLITTISDQNGSFLIPDIDPGKYIVAVLKEQWGIKYIFNVEVQEGDIFDLNQISLYPSTTYSAYIVDDTTFKSDHSYFVPTDATFIGSVSIEARAQIFVSSNCRVKFYGDVTTPVTTDMADAWKFITAKGIYSTTFTELGVDDYYTSIDFYGDQASIHSGIFRYSGSAISTICEQSDISRLIIQYCGAGLSISQGVATIADVIVTDCVNHGINVNSQSIDQTQISSSIITSMNNRGVTLSIPGTYIIDNCYFDSNYEAIKASNCSGTITHNVFNMNMVDIITYQVMIPTNISYNNFYNSGSIAIRPRRNAVVNNNNFFNTNGNFIWIRGPYPTYSEVMGDIDATLNYWAVSNVDDYLADATDNIDYPNEPCPHYVIYTPRRMSRITNAGIQ